MEGTMGGTEDEAVQTVVMITGQGSEAFKAQVRNAFRHGNKGYDQDGIHSVINEYFEDEAGFASKHGWSEDLFSANRDGTNPDQYSYPRSFNVQGPDQTAPGDDTSLQRVYTVLRSHPYAESLPTWFYAAAASMAPKLYQKSDIFLIDRPRTEDEQLQDAIAASLQEQGLTATAPQESGVSAPTSDMSRQYFGPANRSDYDEKSWAMVRTTAKPFDPPPSQRKRDTKAPVFLLCRLEQQKKHRLGPLLMILHAIPAARNFFLLLDGSSPSYGDHKEWWKGEHIFAKTENPEAWASDYQDISLVDELHRLVAFLDQTDRSYGTADSLCETHLIKSAWGGDQILTFYECLYSCASSQELPRLWTVVKIENTSGETRPQEFAILDFRIPEDTPEVLRNLYSQWDNLFWIHQENGWPGWQGRQDEKLPQIASIQTPAQIMTMRIQVDGTGSAVEVPEVLYIDRYLESNVDKARTMQHTMFRIWRACDAAREKEIEVSQWKNPETGQVADRTELTKKVIQRSEDEIWRIRANALWRLYEESIGTEGQIPFLPDELNHLAQLNEDEDKAVKHFQAKIGRAEATLARIDRQLARIRTEKKACCALLEKLNKTLTVPSEDAELNPTHKYSLRGVITSPYVLYMCVRKQRESYSQPDGNGNDDQSYDQWYKTSWVSDGANVVQQVETTFENVQEAMFTEVDANGSRAPILVYATDEAINEQPQSLSAALQSFMKRDNRLFIQELKEEPPSSPRDKKRVAIRSPQSPPKRQRSDSIDSMATNRASIGDFSDGEDRAALLADQFEDGFESDMIPDTEMADMRPISQDEIAAHMVPPTPALSADDASDQGSPGMRRSCERLANFSLNEDESIVQQEEGKAPEMEEQLKSPFIVRRPASSLDNRASIMERPMEIDANLEIPGVKPEDYYHQIS